MAEIDALRFKDRDLQVLGTLEYGQFGVVRHADWSSVPSRTSYPGGRRYLPSRWARVRAKIDRESFRIKDARGT
jgi:hypothetical protein